MNQPQFALIGARQTPGYINMQSVEYWTEDSNPNLCWVKFHSGEMVRVAMPAQQFCDLFEHSMEGKK